MDAREKSRLFVLVSSRHKRVPVFVMMRIDTFGNDASGCPKIKRLKALTVSLKALKLAGVNGIAVEDKRVMQALGVLLNVKFGGGSSGEEDTVMKEADDSNAEMRKEPEVAKKDEPEMVVEPMEELSEEEREKKERKEKALKEKEQGNAAYKKKDFD